MNGLLLAAALTGTTMEFSGEMATVGPLNDPPVTANAEVEVIFSALDAAEVSIMTDDPQIPMLMLAPVQLDLMQPTGERTFSSSNNQLQLKLFGNEADLAGLNFDNFEMVVTEVGVDWWSPDYPTFDTNFTDRLSLRTSDYVLIPEPTAVFFLLIGLLLVAGFMRNAG